MLVLLLSFLVLLPFLPLVLRLSLILRALLLLLLLPLLPRSADDQLSTLLFQDSCLPRSCVVVICNPSFPSSTASMFIISHVKARLLQHTTRTLKIIINAVYSSCSLLEPAASNYLIADTTTSVHRHSSSHSPTGQSLLPLVCFPPSSARVPIFCTLLPFAQDDKKTKTLKSGIWEDKTTTTTKQVVGGIKGDGKKQLNKMRISKETKPNKKKKHSSKKNPPNVGFTVARPFVPVLDIHYRPSW